MAEKMTVAKAKASWEKTKENRIDDAIEMANELARYISMLDEGGARLDGIRTRCRFLISEIDRVYDAYDMLDLLDSLD